MYKVLVLSVEKQFSLWKAYSVKSLREGTFFLGGESIHVLSVEKHFSLWKVYSVKSMREGTLFPGERVYMFFQLRSIFPSGRFTVWSL